jgi:hypothetical protein
LLPEEIRTRVQKQGMRTYVTRDWLASNRERLRSLVATSFMRRVVDPALFNEWLDRDGLALSERNTLWRAANLALWQEQFHAGW